MAAPIRYVFPCLLAWSAAALAQEPSAAKPSADQDGARRAALIEARKREAEALFRDRSRYDFTKLTWKIRTLLGNAEVRRELAISDADLPNVALACDLLVERDDEHRKELLSVGGEQGRKLRRTRRELDRALLEQAIGRERCLRLLQIKWQWDGPMESLREPEVMSALKLRGRKVIDAFRAAQAAGNARWKEVQIGGNPPKMERTAYFMAAFEEQLTPEQRQGWETLIGKRFAFPAPKDWPRELRDPDPEDFYIEAEFTPPRQPGAAEWDRVARGPMPWKLAWRTCAMLGDANVRTDLALTEAQATEAERVRKTLVARDDEHLKRTAARDPQLQERAKARVQEDAELLEKALGGKVVERLRQLRRQFDGPRMAADDPEVAKAFEEPAGQKPLALRAYLRVGPMAAPVGGEPKATKEARQAYWKKLDEAYEAEMSADQRRRWNELIGPKVNFPAPEGWKDGSQVPKLSLPLVPPRAKPVG